MQSTIFLALTPSERWAAARSPFVTSMTTEQLLIILAVAAQTVSLSVVFWLIVRKKRFEHDRKQGIARGANINEGLWQRIDELTQQIEALTAERMASKELKESEEPVEVQ